MDRSYRPSEIGYNIRNKKLELMRAIQGVANVMEAQIPKPSGSSRSTITRAPSQIEQDRMDLLMLITMISRDDPFFNTHIAFLHQILEQFGENPGTKTINDFCEEFAQKTSQDCLYAVISKSFD